MAKKILVCDDDPELRKILALLLGSMAEVLEAADGEAALRVIAERQPDLVLLDVSMPGLSGLQILGRYRASHPKVKTIMLTGHQQIELVLSALSLGALAYITKPFDPEQVKSEVGRALADGGQEPSGGPPDRPWRVVS